jgi:hypothetical protein
MLTRNSACHNSTAYEPQKKAGELMIFDCRFPICCADCLRYAILLIPAKNCSMPEVAYLF